MKSPLLTHIFMEDKMANQQRLTLVNHLAEAPDGCKTRPEVTSNNAEQSGFPPFKVCRIQEMNPEEKEEKPQLVPPPSHHVATNFQDLVTECNCMVKLDEALSAVSYFKNFPKRLQDQDSFCRKKLAQVEVEIEKAISTLREDQESVHEYDKLIAEAYSNCQKALSTQKATEEELVKLEKQLDVNGHQCRENEEMLQKEAEAVLELELQIRTKQCEQVNIRLQALKKRDELNENLLVQINEEINSLKQNLSQRKEQVISWGQSLQEAREKLTISEDALLKMKHRLAEESKAVQQCHELEDRYRGERKEMQDVMENTVEKRRKFILTKLALEKHLLKLSFVEAHHALERKTQFYQNSQNVLLDYHDDESVAFPD